MLSIAVAFAVRCLLVGLFLPFSALDKILNFKQAIGQAARAVPSRPLATALIAGGFGIEVLMSLAILTGVADRLAALILAGYCIVTASLWKQFWKAPDFRLKGESRGRDVFWDFLKNFALAGGFLMLAFGADASGVTRFVSHPLASSHPYTVVENTGR
jgi:putative oxidoreductase